MRRQIFEAFVTPEIETPTLFGCLSLFPYFVVIYAVNHLGFVYNHFGIGMTGLLCLFCLIVLFCGGFLINFMAVSNVFISRMHEKVVCPCVCVSSICWLFLFSSIFALSTSDESPIHQYWQLSQSPMRGLGICDTNEWKESTRGLYFRNGAISRNGMLFDTFQVNVHKCTRLNTKGPWNSCSFRVRPIVPRADCTDVTDCTWEICAWDIARADEPDSWINPNGTAATLGVPRCDEPDPDPGGLCGWVTTLGRMVGGYNGADDGLNELHQGLLLAAKNFQTKSPTLFGHLDFPADLPLLHLGDPVQAAKDLSGWQPFYFGLVFFYVPATVLAMCIFCCRDGGCERFVSAYLHLCEEVAESDDD